MAVRALVLSATLTHVLTSDPSYSVPKIPVDPEDLSKGHTFGEPVIGEDATKFTYRPLDVFLMSHIYDRASIMSQSSDGGTDLKTRINETNIDAVRYGLSGFSNFIGADGNEVPFKTVSRVINGREYQTVTDEIIAMFDVSSLAELAGKIKDASTIKKAVEKN